MLIFSSLSLWLREAGVSRSAVTFFSWAALGYSFKFVWAPLVDRLPLPLLTRLLGRRRAWILLSQAAVIGAILLMAMTDPAGSPSALTVMAIGAVFLGFSSATQDIVIDAYRIECDTPDYQALLSSTYIAGYRVAMVVAGAGALYLASAFGTEKGAYRYEAWMWTYVVMALSMGVGVITTLLMPEPESSEATVNYSTQDYLRFFGLFLVVAGCFVAVFFLSSDLVGGAKEWASGLIGKSFGGFAVATSRLALALVVAFVGARILLRVGFVNKQMVEETYVEPVRDFFRRYGTSVALLLLSLIGLYRVSDIVLGVISNVFYQDLGYTKNDIATVSKSFGVIMTLLGGFLGGILATRFGVMKILFLGGVLAAATNLLFVLLAETEANMTMLYVVISADNLSGGLASAAFVAFISSLTNVSFTAIQYAIFSSLMTLFPKLLGGYSGSLVEVFGYSGFFTLTAVMGLPVLVILVIANRKLELKARGS